MPAEKIAVILKININNSIETFQICLVCVYYTISLLGCQEQRFDQSKNDTKGRYQQQRHSKHY
jgi:hypothetical protein